MIEEFRFSLDFNSPAFLSGTPRGTKSVSILDHGSVVTENPPYFPVDPRGIRIPSLRGVLEFWYRALQGDADSSKEVFDRQAKVFGSADSGQGLMIRPAGMPRFSPNEVLEVEEQRERTCFLYLGYGPLQLLRRPDGSQVVTSHNKNQARDVILPDDRQRGRFRFATRGTREQIEALKRALTLLHLFGGLGARSRRGWGSVEVEAKNEGIAPPAGNAEPAQWIKETLANVWNPGMGSSSDPQFSAFSSGTRIYVTRVLDGGYGRILREFYDRLQDVRSPQNGTAGVSDRKLEREDSRRPASQSITKVPARLAFGMPYQPGYRNNWVMEYHGRLPDGSEKPVTRRASPLLLKVIRFGPNRHAGVALFLPAQFFGNSDLQIGAVGKELTQPFPGYGAVETFLSGSAWTRVLP